MMLFAMNPGYQGSEVLVQLWQDRRDCQLCVHLYLFIRRAVRHHFEDVVFDVCTLLLVCQVNLHINAVNYMH